MAWRNQELTVEDLKKVGLDPALLQELKDQGVKKEELTALKIELTKTITDQIKAGFAELEGKFTASRSNNDGNNNNNNNNNNNDGNNNNNQNNNANNNQTTDIFKIDPIDFATDPETHLRKISTAIVNDSRINTMALRRENAYDRAVSSLKWFKNTIIKDEIDKEWAKYTAQVLVQLNSDPTIVIRKLYDAAVGAHHDDIINDQNKKDGKFNLIQTGGSGSSIMNNNNNNEVTPESLLSPEELKNAAAFGMTAKEWVDQQNDLIAAGKYTRQ